MLLQQLLMSVVIAGSASLVASSRRADELTSGIRVAKLARHVASGCDFTCADVARLAVAVMPCADGDMQSNRKRMANIVKSLTGGRVVPMSDVAGVLRRLGTATLKYTDEDWTGACIQVRKPTNRRSQAPELGVVPYDAAAADKYLHCTKPEAVDILVKRDNEIEDLKASLARSERKRKRNARQGQHNLCNTYARSLYQTQGNQNVGRSAGAKEHQSHP